MTQQTTRRNLPQITSAGATLTAGTVAVGLSGWALGYVALTVIAAGGALAIVVSAALAMRVPDLALDRWIDTQRVQRGQTASALVSAENRGTRRSRPCVLVESIADLMIEERVAPLAVGRNVIIRFELPTHRRGLVEVGPLRLVQTDPFGLFRSERRVGPTSTLFVEPRIHPIDPRPGGRLRHLAGSLTDSAPQGGITFHSLREYSYGDDVRRVHWRSSARTGTLMVREHVDASLPSTVVVLDTRASSYDSSDFEEAVDVAASIVAASQRTGYQVRFVTSCGTSINMRAGQRGTEILDVLTEVQPSAHDDLAWARAEVLRTRHHDAIAVVGGEVNTVMIAEVALLCEHFATATLVTVRPRHDHETRWTQGLHLDGVNAQQALERWHAAGADQRQSGLAS